MVLKLVVSFRAHSPAWNCMFQFLIAIFGFIVQPQPRSHFRVSLAPKQRLCCHCFALQILWCGLVAVHKFSYIAPQRHIIVEIFDNDFGICSKLTSELITDICWTAIDKGTHTIHRWQAVIVMNMLWFMDTATTLDTKMTKHIVRKVQILTSTLFSGVFFYRRLSDHSIRQFGRAVRRYIWKNAWFLYVHLWLCSTTTVVGPQNPLIAGIYQLPTTKMCALHISSRHQHHLYIATTTGNRECFSTAHRVVIASE